MFHHKRIDRRTILRGLGAAVALPWLEVTSTGSASAVGGTSCASASPCRMAFLYVPNGMHMPDWNPKGTGKDFKFGPTLNRIAKFKENLNVISGLTLNGARALGDGGGDHARSVAAFLTGAHPKKTSGSDIKNGPSVDQIAASQIGNQTRLPSLELGTEASSPAGRCDSGYSCAYTSNMSWRTATSPVAKEVDPGLVFDRMFAGSNHQLSAKEKANRRRQKQSILDLVHEDAKSLHRNLGASDKRKLDEYLFAVRDIERRIKNSDKLSGDPLEGLDINRPVGVPRAYKEHVHLMMDMMVLAFQTDTTRIATFMFANAGSNRSYREIDVRAGHHDLSHHGGSKKKHTQIAKINRYHAEMFAYFLEKLSGIKEGSNSLLENSMILYGSGIGDGNRHNHENLPIVLAGNAGGKIKTGHYLKFPRETPLTNLYLSMLQKMGVEKGRIGDSTGRIRLPS